MRVSSFITTVLSFYFVPTLLSLAFGGPLECSSFYSGSDGSRTAVTGSAFSYPKVVVASFPRNAHEVLRQAIPHLLSIFSHKVSVPSIVTAEVKQGGHPLDAHAFPIRKHLVFDETLFDQHPSVRNGVAGHEVGHVIFQASIKSLLSGKYKAPAEWLEFAKHFTDENFLRTQIKNYESRYPSLRSITESDIVASGVSHIDLAMYRTYKSILEKFLLAQTTDAQEGLDLFILHQMGGYHEVFADFVGSSMARDPSWSRRAFSTPASRMLRDFKVTPEQVLDPAVREELEQSVEGGAPHMLLFLLRSRIYEIFYKSEKEELGKDMVYDAEVAKMIIESMLESYQDIVVTVPSGPPGFGPAAGDLVQTLAKAIPAFEKAALQNKSKNRALYEARQRERQIYQSLFSPRAHPTTTSTRPEAVEQEKITIPASRGNHDYRRDGQ